jgi:hypothetical protein
VIPLVASIPVKDPTVRVVQAAQRFTSQEVTAALRDPVVDPATQEGVTTGL